MFFSIVTLTYNRPELLEESVYSVLQQTCKDWELIIINDCASQTILFDHPQVRIFNLKDRFPTIADKRNFGMDNALGDWIFQLDDDDLFLPDYLETFKNFVGATKWLMCQRPILYNSLAEQVYLSPIPQANTFFYSKEVAKEFRYSPDSVNEINDFYIKTKQHGGVRRNALLSPSQCGHVWRYTGLSSRKYSLADFAEKKIPQNQWNSMLQSEIKEENIVLSPHWDKDYTSFIKSNLKVISPEYAYRQVKGGKELMDIVKASMDEYKNRGKIEVPTTPPQTSDKGPVASWEKVKPTWANALKFIEAAKSRGLLSTALDAIGVDGASGKRVSDEVLKQRRLSCFGDKTQNIAPCRRMRTLDNGSQYCSGCGCGKNELAKLNADEEGGYTKLHYPYLECPLKRKGFSNYEENLLSVVITALNEDPTTLNETVRSIRNTSFGVEIIVVDDCSDNIVRVDDPTVRVVRNEKRVGCAPSRSFGASLANNKYLLFTDSHMVFAEGWYEEFIVKSSNQPENVAFCGVCLGLDDTHRTLMDHNGKYNGARLSLFENKENQVLEGKWISEKDGDGYEISCMMGAIYLIDKKYFFKLRGLTDLKMWGSDEPCLSLKILLTGGKIILLKGIQAGHIFRNAAPYQTNMEFLVYNKIRMALTLLPDEIGNKLIHRLPKDNNFKLASELIMKEREVIKEYKAYYRSIFTRDIYDVCKQYEIELP